MSFTTCREGDQNVKCHEGDIGIGLKHLNILNCLEFHPNSTPTDTLIQQVNKLLRNTGSKKDNRRITGLIKCHFLFAELCNGGDLQSWLTQPNEPTRTRASVDNFFAQIVEGVDFLHSVHIIHGESQTDKLSPPSHKERNNCQNRGFWGISLGGWQRSGRQP